MKIAVIDHMGNYGGGSRVVRALLPAIKTVRPEIEITYFGNPATIKRENVQEEFSQYDITVIPLDSVRFSSTGFFNNDLAAKAIKYCQGYFRQYLRHLPYVLSGEVHREIEKKVREYDIAFFPWPFFISVPDLQCPIVGIFHDFNFKYYFSGAFTFSEWQEKQLNKEIPEWLEKVTPVVSTNFMASELAKFYPQFSHKTRVVYLAPNSAVNTIKKEEAEKIVRALGVRIPYILCSTNLNAHKNVGRLFSSMSILRKRGYDLRIVLTGPTTERMRGRACDIGVELTDIDPDVLGLGYVSNLQVDSLIQCSSAVVNPSLYEAGNGLGMDAWGLGVPVAMSNIPAFIEHLEVQGVRAEVFDPCNPVDIANKISNILSDPVKAIADANHSRDALRKITWEKTAMEYLNIFEDTLHR
jgi:glycosyltransferase involved in cell wall biosynthesis